MIVYDFILILRFSASDAHILVVPERKQSEKPTLKNSKNKKYINLPPNPSNAMLTEIETLESCFIDDIFGQVFKEIIGIPIGTNCHSHCRYFSLLPWDIGSANTYQDNTKKNHWS